MKSFSLIIGLYIVSTTLIEVQGFFFLSLVALKGIIIAQLFGGFRNNNQQKRSINENELNDTPTTISSNQIPDQIILSADFQDANDCAKKFICELNAKNKKNLDGIEMVTRSLFGYDDSGRLDVTKPSAHFDFVAVVGRKAGFDQCETIFARCDIPYEDLKKMIEEGLV